VTGGESEGGDCDEVMRRMRQTRRRVNRMRLMERRKKGADSTGNVMHTYLKEQLVICNEEDTDGRTRMPKDEERVLHVL